MKLKKMTNTILLSIAAITITVTAIAADIDSTVEFNPENAVTFRVNIDPDSTDTAIDVTIGDNQVSSEELADAVRLSSGRVLRITSVHGYVFNTPTPPAETDYVIAFVGACGPRLSIRSFGNGPITFSGRSTTQVNYRPGLVANLYPNERFCFRSLSQSNQRAHLEVHGYLQKIPAGKH